MAKLSPFQALVDRQLDSQPILQEERGNNQPATHSVSQAGDQSLHGKSGGKSSSPDYQRLTVYLRRETILDLKRRIAGTNIELSDIVQDAVERWIHLAHNK